MNTVLRKRLIAILVTLTVGVILIVVIQQVLLATVSVSTNKAVIVAIYNTKDDVLVAEASEAGQNHTFRIPRGQYRVEARSGNAASEAHVDLGFRESQDLELSIVDPKPAGLALTARNIDARDIYAVDNRLFVRGLSQPQLYANSLNSLLGTYQTVPLAYGSSFDLISNGNLMIVKRIPGEELLEFYSVEGSTNTLKKVSDYSVPAEATALFASSTSPLLAYRLSDSKVYLLDGAKSEPASFEMSGEQLPEVSLGRNWAVVYFPNEYISHEESGEKVSQKTTIFNLDTKSPHVLEHNSYKALLSPEDKRLASLDAGTLRIYDTNQWSLNSVLYDVTDIIGWQNDDSIYYRRGDGLWRYDTASRTSNLIIANTEGFLTDNITLSQSRDTLLFATVSNSGLVVKKVLLETSEGAALINKELPWATNQFRIDVHGISSDKPQLVVTTLASLNNPSQLATYRKQTQDYRKEALNFIKSLEINLDSVSVRYIPPL